MQMKNKSVFTLLALLGLSIPCLACLQHMGEAFAKRYRISQKTYPVPLGHKIQEIENAAYLESSFIADFGSGDFEGSIDYGVLKVYQGKYAQAEEIFAKIIQKWPEKYEACANYGTILEVNGKLEEALKWLKKAIEISPNSHEGSEWLHLAIIEDKLTKHKQISGAKLTGQDFGNEAEPKPVVDRPATRKLQKDLFYQLNERMTFIEPKDPYIAALLFELGNTCILLDDRKSALENYASAERYGFKSALLKKRKDFAKSDAPMTQTFPPVPVEVEIAASPDSAAAAAPVSEPPASAPTEAPETPQKSIPWLHILIGGAWPC